MTAGQMLANSLDAAFDHAREQVRAHDRDRYYSVLFAPEDRRPYLFALYAFNIEIARIRDVVHDPLPGEVRLQWWRDLLTGEARGEIDANPLAAALLATIDQNKLPRAAMIAMIEARGFDLYDDVMPTWRDLEGYCGETSSALIRLGSIILSKGENPPGAAVAGHAGIAIGFAGLLRNFPWTVSRGQIVLPQEALDHHHIDGLALRAGKDVPGLAGALAEMRQRAREHMEATRAAIDEVDATIAPAFLPCVLVESYLRQMEKPGYDPFRSRIDLSEWRKLWTLWRQGRRALR